MLDLKSVSTMIRPVIENALDRPEMYDVSFSSGVDHDGDDIIVARIEYKAGAATIDARRLLDSVNNAMTLLAGRGDSRFLHIRHVVEEGEAAEDRFTGHRRPRRKAVNQ